MNKKRLLQILIYTNKYDSRKQTAVLLKVSEFTSDIANRAAARLAANSDLCE